MSKSDPSVWPHYGPHGNPDSKDPFEWAQARMPEGWHVEGQIIGNQWMATSLHDDRVIAYGNDLLVDAVSDRGPVR